MYLESIRLLDGQVGMVLIELKKSGWAENIIIFFSVIMEGRKIYNRIAVLHQEKSLTRKDLAEKIGGNFQTIGHLEREEYNSSLDLAFRISEIFELPVDLIFSIEPLKPISQLLTEKL